MTLTHSPPVHLPMLDRVFVSKYSSDMSAAVISALFAGWSLIGRDFHGAPSLIAVAERWPGAENIFGLTALASTVTLILGMALEHRGCRVAGWVVGFSVFFACFLSTMHTLPSDPAAPVFLGMAFGYVWVAALISARIR